MFCENGIKLVKESATNLLGTLNKNLLNDISIEIETDHKILANILSNTEIDKTDPDVKLPLEVFYNKILRNKRCSLIYLNNRLDKLEKICWDLCENLPDHIENTLDERDKKYYKEYHNILRKYSKTLSLNDVEIYKGFNPPKDLFVEVRALDDIGSIEIKDSNNLKIEKNHTYHVKRSDVEIYIRKGLMVINE